MIEIEGKLVELIRNYSGKDRKFKYLEFVEKITYNEENLLDTIQKSLVKHRKKLVEINEQISKVTKKEIKLLNLDYERLLITSE